MQQILQKQTGNSDEKLDITNSNLARLTSLTENILVSVRSQLSNSEKLLEYTEKATALRSTEDNLEAQRDRTAMVEALKKIAENTSGGEKHVSGAEKNEGMSLGRIGAIGTLIAVTLGGIAGALTGYVQTLLKLNKILFSAVESAIVAIGKFFPSIKKMLFSIELNFTLGLELIKNGVKNMFGEVAKRFASATNFITEIINKVLNNSVVKTIVEVFNKVVGAVKAFFQPIRDAFKVIQGASGTVGGIVSSITSKIGVVMEFFSGIGKYFSGIAKIAKASFSIFKTLAVPLTIIMTLWDVVSGAMKGWEEGGLIGAIGGAIKGLFNSLVFGLVDMVKGAISWIAGALGFKGVEKFLDSFSFKDLFSDFVDAVLFIPQTIQNLIMHPIDTLKKLGTTLKNVFSAVVDKFTIFTDILSGLGDLLMDYIIDPLMNAFAPIADFFKSVKDQILGFVENFGIPEIGFTLPIIGTKVSIGPFYPFKSGGSPKGEEAAGAPAKGKSKGKKDSTVFGAEAFDKEWNQLSAEMGGDTKTLEEPSGTKKKSKDKKAAQKDVSQYTAEPTGKPKTLQELALIEAKKFGRSKPNYEDMETAQMEFDAQKTEHQTPVVKPTAQPTGKTVPVQPAAAQLTGKPKTLEQLALIEAKKFGRSKPNYEDMETAQMEFDAQKTEQPTPSVKPTPAPTAQPTARTPAMISRSAANRKEGAEAEAQADIVRKEATALAIDPNKAEGEFEAGVLTSITDTTTGKSYPVAIDPSKQSAVNAVRKMKATMAPAPSGAGAKVYDQSSKNAEMGMKPTPSAPVIISAPTSVNNSTKQSIAMPAPIRNDDNGYNRYVSQNARSARTF